MIQIRISPQILTLNEFRHLVMIAGEEPTIVLGRLAMVALTMASTNRAKFTLAELDSIVAWRRADRAFGELLQKVGFARRHGAMYAVDLPIAGTHPHARGGEVRSATAQRTAGGKFVGADGAISKNIKLVVDAEGNVLKGKS